MTVYGAKYLSISRSRMAAKQKIVIYDVKENRSVIEMSPEEAVKISMQILAEAVNAMEYQSVKEKL